MSQPDPIAWINAVLRNPETGKPFELLPAEIAFLQHAFRLDDDGRAVYPELTYSAPKKTGKTAFGAINGLTATLLYGGRDAEAICAANDLEQSQSRVFSAIKKIVRASPALRDRAKITNREITFPDTGAVITAIANDAAGAAGANPVLSIGDELWGFTSESSRRLWDELVPPPTRKASWRLVTTYAGFSGESTLLEEVYKHGTAQPMIAPDLYAGEGHLCFWTHKPQAPWQTDAWLAQMRRSLRPNQYARMIENRWVTSESAFIEMAAWDRCVDTGLQPLAADRNMPVFIGIDASTKRDSTALVVVTTDGERVRLVTHRIFQPSPDQPIDFESMIEQTIVDWCGKFNVQAVRYDPWQMAAVAQRLIKRGVPMEEFPQTTSNLTDSSSNLYELIRAGNLQVYADEAMRLSISQAIAIETPRGWRIAKEKQRHKIDVVVALAMASVAAVKQEMVPGWGVLEHYRRQSEAVTATASTPPTLTAEHPHLAYRVGADPQPITDAVKIIMPKGMQPSVLDIGGRRYHADVVDGRWIFHVAPADAAVILSNPRNIDLLACNVAAVARVRHLPAQLPGVRASDTIMAALDQREARPQTIVEEQAAFFRARNASITETLALYGRTPR